MGRCNTLTKQWPQAAAFKANIELPEALAQYGFASDRANTPNGRPAPENTVLKVIWAINRSREDFVIDNKRLTPIAIFAITLI